MFCPTSLLFFDIQLLFYYINLGSSITCCRFPGVMATSNFMNEICNGGFAPDFSVSMLDETITLVWDYVSETMK